MEYVGNIIYDMFLKQDDMDLVIFGAGRSGRKVYDFLDRNDRAHNVKYFCDTNENMWGKRIAGIEVVNPMHVIKSAIKYHFLVSGVYADDMAKFLVKNDVTRIHILFI